MVLIHGWGLELARCGYKESVVQYLWGVEGLELSEIERLIEQAAELPRERRALLDALSEAKRGDEGP